jgi:TetR/AcrR family transcriptional repressor of nem operon
MPDVKHFDPNAALDTAVHLAWRQGIAATGIQDIVTATGVSRSSLYATFGSKQNLYRAVLSRYIARHSQPAFDRLANDGRGLPAITDFFTRLIQARCFGQYARWGCMISNAHAGAENDDPAVRRILRCHHTKLRAAMHAALLAAKDRAQLRPDLDPHTTSDQLALLAYGVNLRSRAGADAAGLLATVTATVEAFRAPVPTTKDKTNDDPVPHPH